jgi:hypothetical protein
MENKAMAGEVVIEDPLNAFRFENDWTIPLWGCFEDLKLSN